MDLTLIVGETLSQETDIRCMVGLDETGQPRRKTQQAMQEFDLSHVVGKAAIRFDYLPQCAEYPDGVVFFNENDMSSAQEKARKAGASAVGVGTNYLDEECGKVSLKFYG